MTIQAPTADDVISFWFEEIEPKSWWTKSASFDKLIRDRFADVHAQANRCELFTWRSSPQGRLAEVIVLDQFSRNMYRDTPQAFASDVLALGLAQEAVAVGADLHLDSEQRQFLYLPFMHSESRIVHHEATRLYAEHGTPSQQNFERRHCEIIERFGRYPHRNAVLGRTSSSEEAEFLNQPGSSF